MEHVELDEIDEHLVDLLVLDGRRTNRSLAEEVGLTDATVANRIRRLVDNGVLAVVPLFDWDVAGFKNFAIAYIRTAGGGRPPARSRRSGGKAAAIGPRAVGEVLATYPGVMSVELTYGDADLVVMLLATDDVEMHRLATRISGTPGVASMRTNHVVELGTWVRNTAILPYETTALEDLPDPPFEFDEVDVGIITRLQADGRESSREMAGYVGVSDATVRARRRRLEEAGLVRVRALFDPFRVGRLGAAAQVGLVVSGDVAAIMEKFSAEPWMGFCATTVGAHNVSCGLVATDHEELALLLTETLWDFDGVESVQAWPLADVIHHRSDLVRFI